MNNYQREPLVGPFSSNQTFVLLLLMILSSHAILHYSAIIIITIVIMCINFNDCNNLIKKIDRKMTFDSETLIWIETLKETSHLKNFVERLNAFKKR